MNPLFYLFIFAVICSILGLAYNARARSRDNSALGQEHDAEKEEIFKSMLDSDEIFYAHCCIDPKANYYIAVTNQRLIIDTKDGVESVRLANIKKISYQNATGNKVSPESGNVNIVTVKADKKYIFVRYSSKLDNVISALVNLGWK